MNMFKLVYAVHVNVFEERVSAHLSDGWTIAGPMYVHEVSPGKTFYMPMFKNIITRPTVVNKQND